MKSIVVGVIGLAMGSITAIAAAQPPPAQPPPVQQQPMPPPGYEQQPPPPGAQPQPQPYPQQYPAQPGYPAAGQPVAPVVPMPAEPPPRNTITINPLAMIFGIVNFEYERALGDSISFFIGPELLVWNGLVYAENFDLVAYGLSFGLRIFFSGMAPQGTWIGPQLGYAYVSVEDTSSGAKVSASAIGIYGLIGHTWIWDAFVFSLGGGLGYVAAVAEETSGGTSSYEASRVGIALRASLGFAF